MRLTRRDALAVLASAGILGEGSVAVISRGDRESTGRARDIEDAEDEVSIQTDAIHPVFHPMGTTRMRMDPEMSVVDPRLRTHDLSNLSVASSSVFVTGGAMNPTLTIAAIALKAADHVDAVL